MTSSTSLDRASQLLGDPVLTEIRDAIVASLPCCRAIIIIGSRATSSPSAAATFQDYDIVVVVPTLRTPMALRTLRRVEASITETYGVKVSLNPVPWLRLRYPDSNYMLLKLGVEGVVIYGNAALDRVRRIRPESISAWWYFFFLASQARRLLINAPLPFDDDSHRRKTQYNAAKAVLGCAELLVLRSGRYSSSPEILVDSLTSAGRPEMAAQVELAYQVILSAGAETQPSIPWSSARSRILDTLDEFSNDYLDVKSAALAEFPRAFLRSGGVKSPLRDIQFVALRLLGNRDFRFRTLLDRRGISERVKLGLFGLLMAWREDAPPDDAALALVRSQLGGAISLGPMSEGWGEWTSLLKSIEGYYPSACVALGI